MSHTWSSKGRREMAKLKSPSNSGQFRKGNSGNPEGRPKAVKEKQVSAFDIVTEQVLTVTQNGVSREATAEEALQHRAYRDAIGGSRSAQRVILKMIAKREKWLAAKGDRNWPRFTSRLEPVDPQNADAALQILGIATHDAGRDRWEDKREPLLLELWAVQAALARRRGGDRLTDIEVRQVERCTREAMKLRWPRGRVG